MSKTGNRLMVIMAVVCVGMIFSCAHGDRRSSGEPSLRIDRKMLIGVWASDGRTFDFVIEDDTILYEYEMVKHSYTIKNNVIIVDHGRELGTRRSRILELTEETLVLQDLETENTATFMRRQ